MQELAGGRGIGALLEGGLQVMNRIRRPAGDVGQSGSEVEVRIRQIGLDSERGFEVRDGVGAAGGEVHQDRSQIEVRLQVFRVQPQRGFVLGDSVGRPIGDRHQEIPQIEVRLSVVGTDAQGGLILGDGGGRLVADQHVSERVMRLSGIGPEPQRGPQVGNGFRLAAGEPGQQAAEVQARVGIIRIEPKSSFILSDSLRELARNLR